MVPTQPEETSSPGNQKHPNTADLDIAMDAAKNAQDGHTPLVKADEALEEHAGIKRRSVDIKAGLAAILEVTHDLVGMADVDGGMLYLNQAGRKMLDWGSEEDVHKLMFSHCFPDWANEIIHREGIPTAIREGVWSHELVLRSRSGREIPVVQTLLTHKDPKGKADFFSLIARDITATKQAEEERKELLKEYRMMFDSVPALIWYKDRNNRILRVNRPAAESMGKQVVELEGKSTYDLYPDEAAKYHRDDLEVIESRRPKLGILEQIETRSGDKIWVRTDKVPYRNERGEIIGVIVFAVDITERQQAQEEVRKLNQELEARVVERTAQLETANQQLHAENLVRKNAEEALALRARELDEANKKLIEAERVKSDFFANVSHELRTPLTLALAPLESMLSGETALASDEQRRVLTTVYNNALRLLHMVTGLLDFSKYEAGRIVVQREPVEVVSLTQSILADFAPMMHQKGLEKHLITSTSRIMVMLDRYLWERILFNLLANAIKFTPEAGTVSVSLAYQEERLRLSVTDTGIGIAAEDVQHLFQKFRQLEGSATRRFEGTGLGLALVKEFAGLLGGHVSVQSRLGQGSTFTIECHAPPTEEPPGDPSSQERQSTRIRSFVTETEEAYSPSALPQSAHKILIAEDNIELASYIDSLLRHDYQTRIARDGEEALAIVRDWSPNLLLTDVMMPRMDGLTLCKEMKSHTETARVIVVLLTAMTHREALLKGWEAGADEYLFKPFHPSELKTRIRTLLTAVQERHSAEEKLRLTAEELERSNRELEIFAYVASHDLQEPLRMVASYMELLQQRYQGQLDEKANRWISFAVGGVVRMKQLIHDLLEYSRVVTRSNLMQVTDCNLVFQTVLQNLEPSIQQSDALITSSLLPTIKADTTHITVVLQNLISNAIKYRSQRRPEVHVEAREQAGGWVFSVRDNGIGIEPQFFERIFIIFQRLHTRDEYPGTGIGLSVCKKIVERHGGRIWIESEPGQGTTFYFSIPDSSSYDALMAHSLHGDLPS